LIKIKKFHASKDNVKTIAVWPSPIISATSKLSQEDHLSSGVQGYPEQHSKTYFKTTTNTKTLPEE
jgi:hypothetical protein